MQSPGDRQWRRRRRRRRRRRDRSWIPVVAMTDLIVISDSSDTERERGTPRKRLRTPRRYPPAPSPYCNPVFIDLTEDDSTVIDLTLSERMDVSDDTGVELDSEPSGTGECSYFTSDVDIKDEIPETSGGVSYVRLLDEDCEQKVKLSPRSTSSIDSSDGLSPHSLELGSSHTMFNSDMGSLDSLQLEGESSSSPNSPSVHMCEEWLSDDLQDTASKSFNENSVTMQPDLQTSSSTLSRPPSDLSPVRIPHPPVLDSSSSQDSTAMKIMQRIFLGVDSKSVITEQNPDSPRQYPSNRAWLNKLRYFWNPPVHHLFFQNLKQDVEVRKKQCLQPKPIPDRRLRMVRSTIEENFPQGTLQFLIDFVSLQHYPPKDIISHVVNKILLGMHSLDVLTDAYMLLMKIQKFHPASVSTVTWDWKLLSYVMEKMDALPSQVLFLQYVIQTLEDDFQVNLRRRILQKSIAKSALSCDQHFSNVRNVIEWLVNAVKFSSSDVAEDQPDTDLRRSRVQSMVCLLQRMLSIAVEVDKSPTCSSAKIADTLFPVFLSIPKRSQREIFFNSMESPLLRAKLINIMFDHSCESLPSLPLPLSLAKILYFLKHSTLLLEYQDSTGEWQRWDEMLHHLCLLFLSYQRILTEHLRTSVTERINLIIQEVKPQLTHHDDISTQDVELHMSAFCNRVSQLQGEVLSPALQMRICVLRTLLDMATSQNRSA
ncbi:SUMO-interacting motif-containing protein 1 isoform X2 [Microcaecilia unicolor]|uniref:SUMO-interacting motif-containing protein 1 isoform X2 n=1 Tax=Microcaecilia unicolor TaxID=1415580 RepID=A0A6P7YKS0_9AMPH|nr:SUMO-interacting motif-containing protein 1 isoform X2 [Microcaecilia unicolor]